MNVKELCKVIWEICDDVKKDHEKGFESYLQKSKTISDSDFEVFKLELIKMCLNILKEEPYTTPISIIFNKILLDIQNDYELKNPRVKIKFAEKSSVSCSVFVKYFYLLKKEKTITNTLEELTLLISVITDFKEESINKVLNNPKSISKTNMLLPKGYIKRPDVKKTNLS
jgi:hypothetical protein